MERFWSKTVEDPETGCLLWTAARYPNGYGIFRLDGRSRLAHRVAYELAIGPIPEGLTIDHVRARGCRHRHCVSPDHLEPVTQRENLMRGDTLVAAAAAKTHCAHGHPFDAANTMLQRDGSRKCRQCDTARQEAKRRAKGVPLGNPRKTHCPRGHAYDEANTRYETHGGSTHRKCRACQREDARNRRQRVAANA